MVGVMFMQMQEVQTGNAATMMVDQCLLKTERLSNLLHCSYLKMSL